MSHRRPDLPQAVFSSAADTKLALRQCLDDLCESPPLSQECTIPPFEKNLTCTGPSIVQGLGHSVALLSSADVEKFTAQAGRWPLPGIDDSWVRQGSSIASVYGSWSNKLQRIIDRVSNCLDLLASGDEQSVRAELTFLIIHGPGEKGVRYSLPPCSKDPAHLATLDIYLPCEHEGGKVIVSSENDKVVLGENHGFETFIRFVAFRRDDLVKYEMRPLNSGYRVLLRFQLLSSPTTPSFGLRLSCLEEDLLRWKRAIPNDSTMPRRLIFPLDQVQLANLVSNRVSARACLAMLDRLCFVGLLVIIEPDQRPQSSPSIFCSTNMRLKSAVALGEVSSDWSSLSGSQLSLDCIVQSGVNTTIQWQGDEASQFKALMLLPRLYLPDFLKGLSWSFGNILDDHTSLLHHDPSNEDYRQCIDRLCTRIIHDQQSAKEKTRFHMSHSLQLSEDNVYKVANASKLTGNTANFEKAMSTFSMNLLPDFFTTLAKTIDEDDFQTFQTGLGIALLRLNTVKAFIEALTQLSRVLDSEATNCLAFTPWRRCALIVFASKLHDVQPDQTSPLFNALRDHCGVPQLYQSATTLIAKQGLTFAVKLALTSELISTLTTKHMESAIFRDTSRDLIFILLEALPQGQQPRGAIIEENTTFDARHMMHLLRTLIRTDMMDCASTLLSSMANRCPEWPADGFEMSLVPFVEGCLDFLIADEPSALIADLKAFCREVLGWYVIKAIGTRPVEPADWRRPPRGCGCLVCNTLDSFLTSETRMESAFQLPKAQRLHLQCQLNESFEREAAIDVQAGTEKSAIPHTLWLTKTNKSFRNKLLEWERTRKTTKRTLSDLGSVLELRSFLGKELASAVKALDPNRILKALNPDVPAPDKAQKPQLKECKKIELRKTSANMATTVKAEQVSRSTRSDRTFQAPTHVKPKPVEERSNRASIPKSKRLPKKSIVVIDLTSSPLKIEPEQRIALQERSTNITPSLVRKKSMPLQKAARSEIAMKTTSSPRKPPLPIDSTMDHSPVTIKREPYNRPAFRTPKRRQEATVRKTCVRPTLVLKDRPVVIDLTLDSSP